MGGLRRRIRSNVRLPIAIASAWTAVALGASGQRSGPDAGFFSGFPTDPPASHVLDESDLFRHDAATLDRISARLAGFEKRREIPIFLAVYPGLIGTTPARRAADLQRVWLDGRYGFVLVFDSDTGELGLGRSIEFEEAGDAEAPADRTWIPTYELLGIMLRVNERMKPNDNRVEYLDKLVEEVVSEFDASLERIDAPPSRADRLRFGLIVAGLIAAIGLVALVFSRWLSNAERRAGRRHRFPSVLVGQRLGASYGGGRVSSRSFRESSGGGAGSEAGSQEDGGG